MQVKKVFTPPPPASALLSSTPGVPQDFRRRCDIDGTLAFVRQQIHISPDTAITWDANQWIVNKNIHTDEMSGMSIRLKPFAYVATEKRILLRILLENDITPDAEGQANLNSIPEDSQTFIKEHTP